MKLGVFDSGLGGLLIAKAIRQALPDIDMLYYGDTLHVPYGGRSQESIHRYTLDAVKNMFAMDCQLIIIACNTASAAALRKIQQEYLPQAYPDRRVLGVIVPTLETAIERNHKKFGLLATRYIAQSGMYQHELTKLDPSITLRAQAAPLLVPMIEQGGIKWIDPILQEYLQPFVEDKPDCLLLGCTHYPYLKEKIQRILPDTDILSQDELIPQKLVDYLERHPEIDSKINKNSKNEFYVTDITENYADGAKQLYSHAIELQKAEIAA